MLDTDFADGARFLSVWRHWRSALGPGRMLHYVGLLPLGKPPAPPSGDPQTQELALALAEVDGREGFHRLHLDDGQVSLTLCLGDAPTALAQQSLQADVVYLGPTCQHAPAWAAVAKCCKRGTRIHLDTAAKNLTTDTIAALSALGFRPGTAPEWVFDPAWPVLRSRQSPRAVWTQVQRCTVIGAGISGAAVARALALRGWQVQVLDAKPHPAAGASGLPAGLVSPVISADHGPVSQLTRSGCALMRQHAQALLLHGQDWEASGACLKRPAVLGAQDAAAAQWLPEAFWLQPATLVRAWLATAGAAFTGSARVHRLERQGEDWVCLNEAGHALARSPLLVIANALDAARLLAPTGAANATPAMAQALARLHPMYGGVSMGPSAGVPQLPAQPVQGRGNFLPSVPLVQSADNDHPKELDLGRFWLAGASFDAQQSADATAQRQANHARLAQQLPEVADALAPQFDAAQVQLWRGQRCVSHDRLPLVGAVQAAPDASLWISAGMGARGLSLAALCAELLAARIHGEPLPVPARLAKLLDAQRLQRQRA